VVPSFAARWLLPRVGRFIARHPDIDLDVGASNVNVDFRQDTADVAIRYGYGQWEGVRAEHLMDDVVFPVCSPGIAGGVPRRPVDLANYTLLRADNEPWKPWFDAAGLDWPEPDRGMIFHDSSHMLQAAAEGQGVALARLRLLGNDERNGLLVRPFAIELPAPRRFYLVYPPHHAQAPKLIALRDWLREEIALEQTQSGPSVRRPPAAQV
jgi:LysR family glycine cleavage system transcriptional activator